MRTARFWFLSQWCHLLQVKTTLLFWLSLYSQLLSLPTLRNPHQIKEDGGYPFPTLFFMHVASYPLLLAKWDFVQRSYCASGQRRRPRAPADTMWPHLGFLLGSPWCLSASASELCVMMTLPVSVHHNGAQRCNLSPPPPLPVGHNDSVPMQAWKGFVQVQGFCFQWCLPALPCPSFLFLLPPVSLYFYSTIYLPACLQPHICIFIYIYFFGGGHSSVFYHMRVLNPFLVEPQRDGTLCSSSGLKHSIDSATIKCGSTGQEQNVHPTVYLIDHHIEQSLQIKP